MIHSSRVRSSASKPFARFVIDLSNTIMNIDRVYPTFVDMVSRFGGIAEVIFFLFSGVLILHEHIVMDQILINDAILYKDQEEQARDFKLAKEESLNRAKNKVQDLGMANRYETRAFTYFEIAKFKYGCCGKKKERAKKYTELMKVLGERLDIGSVVASCANVNLLSNVLLEPYQMKLIA